jgi:hypothetical protein
VKAYRRIKRCNIPAWQNDIAEIPVSAAPPGAERRATKLRLWRDHTVRNQDKHVITALFVFAVLTFPGCSKVTQANFDKIRPEMSLKQVEAILGKGEVVLDSNKDVNALMGILATIPKKHQGKRVTKVKWQSGNKVIYVVFVGENCEANIFKSAAFP